MRRRAAVCVYRPFRQGGGWGRWIFFFFLSRFHGKTTATAAGRLRPRRAGRLSDDERKKGRKSSRRQKASDKTKHPGGCLRAAPVIRDAGGPVWWIDGVRRRVSASRKSAGVATPDRESRMCLRRRSPRIERILGVCAGFAPVGCDRSGLGVSIRRRACNPENERIRDVGRAKRAQRRRAN